MSLLQGVRARLRELWWRSAADARMDDEFRFHLEMETEQNLRRGLPAGEARRRAHVSFGGIEKHKISMRQARRVWLLEDFWQDVRHALRSLLRVPGFALAAILTLALGIGLTATMFSVVYGVLFRGLPYRGADRIVHVNHVSTLPGEPDPGITIHEYQEYVRRQRSFEELGAFRIADMTVSGGEDAARFRGARVSANTFSLIGVQPALGRGFSEAEQNGHGAVVAVIGHDLWQSRYQGDAHILGRSIRVDGRTATIVGVMPPHFTFPERQQLWLPLEVDAVATQRGEGPGLDAFGRLRAGTSLADAARDLSRIAATLERDAGRKHEVRPVVARFIDFILGPGPRALLFTMFAAVGFVLLIACTNVANLLLSRAIVRSREVGIRAALGAGRARIVRQFLAEAGVLSVVGAAIGLWFAYAGTRAFNSAFAAYVPSWMAVQLDRPALAFITALTVLTAFLAGILPAIQASRTDPGAVLSDGSRGATSFRIGRVSRVLVVFEVALSCALLVGAALCTKSVIALRGVDLGFDGSRIFTAALWLPDPQYADSALPRAYAQLSAAMSGVGAFERSALASSLPGLGDAATRFAIDGQPAGTAAELPFTMRVAITPSYLGTLGVSVLEGRNITATDVAGAEPVMLVNRGFAQKYFPHQNVIGRRIRLLSDSASDFSRTIVGVVPDLRFGELAGDDQRETVLIPLAQQREQRFLNVIGRTRTAALLPAADVRAAVAGFDRDLPLLHSNTLRGAIARDTWFFELFGGVFMVFGATALLLAAIGLYGVMSFAVGQRRREIGIRLALGATAEHVRGMLLRHGLLQTAIGISVGLALGFAVSRLLSVILFEAAPGDPFVFAGVVGTLFGTAALACLVPARRATSIQPVETLQA